MAKLTLTDIDNLENENSAVAVLAANNAATEAAMENTVSLDGTVPNTFTGNVDFSGGGRILNLPQPLTALEPLRLTDLNSFIGGGTISSIPAGGNTGDILTKHSGTDFDATWTADSTAVQGDGALITVSGTSPATITFAGTSASMLAAITDETGTGKLVFATSPTFITPLLGTPTSGVLSNCTGLPLGSITGLGSNVATALAATLNGSGAISATTSPVLVTPTLGTALATSINKVALTAPASLATITLATATTLTTTSTVSVGAGQYTGEPGTGSATAGNIGEYIESVIASGSAIGLTTATPANLTSISLTAGDWDVDLVVNYIAAATTSVTRILSGVSLTTATFDLTGGRAAGTFMNANVSGGAPMTYSVAVPPLRFSISGNTTVFGVAQATFTAAALTVYGILRARRIR